MAINGPHRGDLVHVSVYINLNQFESNTFGMKKEREREKVFNFLQRIKRATKKGDSKSSSKISIENKNDDVLYLLSCRPMRINISLKHQTSSSSLFFIIIHLFHETLKWAQGISSYSLKKKKKRKKINKFVLYICQMTWHTVNMVINFPKWWPLLLNKTYKISNFIIVI